MRTALPGPGCPGRGGAGLVPVPVPGSSRLRALWPCLRGLLGRGAGRAMAAAAWMPAVGAGPGRESAAGCVGLRGKRGAATAGSEGSAGGAGGEGAAGRCGATPAAVTLRRPGPARPQQDGCAARTEGGMAGSVAGLRAAGHGAHALRWDRAAPGAVLGVCRSLRPRPGARCARPGPGAMRGRSRAGSGCSRHGERGRAACLGRRLPHPAAAPRARVWGKD